MRARVCVGRRVNERDSRKVSTFRSGNGFGSPCHCERVSRDIRAAVAAGNKRLSPRYRGKSCCGQPYLPRE